MKAEACIDQSVTEEDKWDCVGGEQAIAASDVLKAFKIALE